MYAAAVEGLETSFSVKVSNKFPSKSTIVQFVESSKTTSSNGQL